MKQKGFTMIFVLVGILVIGIIGYVGIRSINSHFPIVDKQSNGLLPTRTPDEDSDYTRKNDLTSLRNAIEMYTVDHEGNYPTTLSVLGEPYLKSIPRDPVTNKEYSFVFTPPDKYTLSATLTDGSTFYLYDLVTEDQMRR